MRALLSCPVLILLALLWLEKWAGIRTGSFGRNTANANLGNSFACLHAGVHFDPPGETRRKQGAPAAAHKAQEGLHRAKQAVKEPVQNPKETKEAAKESAGKLPPPSHVATRRAHADCLESA